MSHLQKSPLFVKTARVSWGLQYACAGHLSLFGNLRIIRNCMFVYSAVHIYLNISLANVWLFALLARTISPGSATAIWFPALSPLRA